MKNSFERISALLMRYTFLLQSSWPRLFELAFWPSLEVILWGYTSIYFVQHMNTTNYGISILVGGALLWDFLVRVQFGVSLSFLEEFYSRNLGHLFISPIRTWEIISALLCFSTLRAFIAIIPASLLAALFFQFNIFSMGFSLIIFVICLLMMGWWIGFIAMSIIVKYGVGTESLTWMFAYLLAPAAAVFYPVATLPHWLQIIAFIMPASHIFEGMRTIIIEQRFDSGQLLWAFGLNLIYLAVAILLLMQSLKGARNRGALLVVGE